MDTSPVLEVKRLYKQYDNQGSNEDVLRNINLSVMPEEFVCILGPSGCGKTTFLRCIGGFESFQGEILMKGKPVIKAGPDRIMVFQSFDQLFSWKTVEKNIQYPLKIQGLKNKKALKDASDTYLEKVGLLKYKKFYPRQLSGGMKQRVAIAKALALKPQIILMDEPFASLDAMTRNKLQEELVNIKEKEKLTVIFITHNIQEALVLGTRILVMSDRGKFSMDVENKLEKPVTPAAKAYGEYWNMLHNALKGPDTDEPMKEVQK